MSAESQCVSSLHLWTDGDPRVGIQGETAEVSAPGWLLNSADTDPETNRVLLASFKAKIVEAFSVIWEDEPKAAYDFELAAQNASLEAE